MIYALLTGNHPLLDFDLDSLPPLAPDSWQTYHPRVRLTKFIRAVCSLCSDLKALAKKLSHTADDVKQLQQLKVDVFRIEDGMQDWTRDLPAWQPYHKEVSLHSTDIRQFAHSDLVEYHQNAFALTNWNLYRISRMVLHKTLLEIDRFFQVNAERPILPEFAPAISTQIPLIPSFLTLEERHSCQTTFVSLSSQVLGTIPYTLGEIDSKGMVFNPLLHGPRSCAGKAFPGLTIVWPLRMIKQSPYTTDRQKHLAKEALKRIGWTMGIRQALEVADM